MFEDAAIHAVKHTFESVAAFPIDVLLFRILVWAGLFDLCDLPKPSWAQTAGVVALALTVIH